MAPKIITIKKKLIILVSPPICIYNRQYNFFLTSLLTVVSPEKFESTKPDYFTGGFLNINKLYSVVISRWVSIAV